MQVFIDESGNTEMGMNDKAQLFYVVGSHNASNEQCAQYIDKCFPKNNRKEVHYVSAKKNLDRISCLYDSMVEYNIRTQACLMYKPYFFFNSFITMLHDPILEAHSFNTGHPVFIVSRRNYMWFYFLLNMGGDFLKNSIDLYLDFVREPEDESLNKLLEYLKSGHIDPQRELESITNFYSSRKHKDEILKNVCDRSKNEPSWIDITLPSLIEILKCWSHINDYKSFEIYHDKSTLLSMRQSTIDIFMNVPRRTSSRGIYNSLVDFGISVERFDLVDSKENPGIQIADVIAGVVNQSAKALINGTKENALQRLMNVFPEESLLLCIPCVDDMTTENRDRLSVNNRFLVYPDPLAFKNFSI